MAARVTTRPVCDAAAREAFQGRAQEWLRERGSMTLPRDESAVIALGVPCEVCGVVVRTRHGAVRHVVRFGTPAPGGHWASRITAHCG